MTKIKAHFMTTHLDRHGERFPLEALESAKSQLEKNIITHGVEHDPRIEPVGRVISAEIVKLDDGEFALEATSELFDELDKLEEINDRELLIHEYSENSLEIRSDRNYRNEEDAKILNEISDLLKCTHPPQEEIKKAFEPLSVLWICGAFILGGISSGFLNKIGSEAFDLLKDKLSKILSKRKPGENEKLLAFEFSITDKKCNVELIITNPTSEDINKVMKEGFKQLDLILPKYFEISSEKPIKKLVFELDDKNLKFKFGVRSDGIPFK